VRHPDASHIAKVEIGMFLSMRSPYA